ncbi:helix-turn-helix domain-containing protein [Schleiferilactobacillus harbinensis]|uniref:helix-turn-helix domain-containing protein n=1 Tax=Schleiferilactobacillus harbinensis TaxID=304207 RepID=UPI0007B9082C|nr:helix-turn-helix transcriptional regulator [Schleiferilactobacillus harbinensis]
MIEFGITLKKIRLAKGYSQRFVAEQLNLTRQTVSKWENGRGYPDFENLVLLSGLYGVSIDQLVNRKTLNLDRQKVLQMNRKREKVLWLTRQAKILVIAVLTVLVVVSGITFVIAQREQAREEAETVPISRYYVYAVDIKRVVLEKDKTGATTGIISVTTKNNEKIQHPTLTDLTRRRLIIKPKTVESMDPDKVEALSKAALARNIK